MFKDIVKIFKKKNSIQELRWWANSDMSLIWSYERGRAYYDPATNTVTMLWETYKEDGTSTATIKTDISVEEALTEICKLRQRETLGSWEYTKNTWQSVLNEQLFAVHADAPLNWVYSK